MYEMERKMLEWQHAFAKDERERSRQVKSSSIDSSCVTSMRDIVYNLLCVWFYQHGTIIRGTRKRSLQHAKIANSMRR